MWSLSLINSFSFARNVTMTSSLADVASPVIFIFFSPNLFLKLCNHLLLAVNGLVSLISGNPLLKSLYRLNVFWHNTLPSVRTYFLFTSFTHKFNAFFILTKYFSHTSAVTSATAKLAQISFFLHNFMDRRFVLTMDLSNLSIHFFSFP